MRLRCHLYEAFSSRRREGWLCKEGERLLVALPGGDGEAEEVEEIEPRRVEPPVANGPRRIQLADGRALEVLDPIPPGFLPGHDKRLHRWVLWWERFSLPKAALLLVVLAACLFGVRAALPVAADQASRLVPYAAEAYVGESAFEQYESLLDLEPSGLPEARQERLRAGAEAMRRAAGMEHDPAILFRKGGAIPGANAFAFPGGPVVVTDALVELLEEDRLILAVIAHELAHVEGRHGLRQIARAAGALLIMTVALGGSDVSGVEELTTLALAVASNGYSREFESLADLRGAEMIRTAGGTPDDLADALDKLGEVCGELCEEGGFFSTHPGMRERTKALRALE